MTAQELSNSFDTLLNSYASSAQFGEQASKREVVLDEYEKSLFLTKAQEEVIVNLYNGRNPLGESFETTEELRRYLESLVKTATLTEVTTSVPTKVSENSHIYALPDGTTQDKPPVWFITFEQVKFDSDSMKCKDNLYASVYPVKQDEYTKVKRNPFRGPTKYKVLRMDRGEGYAELISKYDIDSYMIKYLSKPAPIILEDLGTLEIDGKSTPQEFNLHPTLYRVILDRAVLMALQSKGYNINP